MSEGKVAAFAYPRLCVAYFCEFAIWAAWAGTLSVFAGSSLRFTSNEVAWLYCAIPFGAIIGPLFVGPLADRYFSAQKVISVLHFIGGIALLACGYLCHTQQATFPLLMGLLLLSGICYMPTQGLLNSIVFQNLSKPSMGPYVFVFGTIGWIISSLLIAAFFGGEKSYNFFFVGSGFSIFLAIYSLTLPNTPPKGNTSGGEVKRNFLVSTFGLDAFKLFKDPAFALFAICAFLASIPACGFYFIVQTPYLSQMGYPSPVALTTLNQFSEIFFMTALSTIVLIVGLKVVLLLGMFAWCCRYIIFALPGYGIAPEYDFVFSVIGLLFHGFSYSFLYVGAYMYADSKAPANLKASVQSMMIFLLLGVGQVLGAQIYPPLADKNKPVIENVIVSVDQLKAADKDNLESILQHEVSVPIPAWNDDESSWIQYLDLASQTKKLMGVTDTASSRNIDLGKLLKDQPLSPKSIDDLQEDQLIQDGVKIQYGEKKNKEVTVTVQYKKEDLKKICETISAGKQDYSLTRKNWLNAQAFGWKNIFTIPAAFIGVFFLIFLIFGQSPKDTNKEKNTKDEDKK